MIVRTEWKRRYVLCYSTEPTKGKMISEINSGKRRRIYAKRNNIIR